MTPTANRLQHLDHPIDPKVFPEGQTTKPGTIAIIPWWTLMSFTYPNQRPIALSAEQFSQTVTQTEDDPMPVWSPPYYVGTVNMTEEEILLLPSADAFFGELFQALDAKLAAQTAPPLPAIPLP